MTELNIVSAFLMGLAGGVHCVGMCGGIAGAFSFAVPKHASLQLYVACYNAGRILSYTLAGAVTGYLGAIASSSIKTTLPILQFISAVFLILLALYISNWFKGLSYLERIGAILWRKIQPLSKSLIPFKHPGFALGYGMIWGWLPCGLVYTALTWSLASGDSLSGATFMLFFGLGTLPALIASSLGAKYLVVFLQNKFFRALVSFFLIIFALVLIFSMYRSIT